MPLADVIQFIFWSCIGDKLGRGLPTVLGSVVIFVEVIIEFLTTFLDMYAGGKPFLGFGSSLIQIGVPVLVTKLSHPKERVQITTFPNTSIVLSYVMGAENLAVIALDASGRGDF